jgi:hypothetical protein
MSQDFEALAHAPVEVAYRGETLQVTPITLGELPAFARAVGPAAPALLALAKSFEGGDEVSLAAMDLLEQHGNAMTELVAVGVRRPVEWVRGATRPEELLTLLGVVMQVNADFFRRHLVLAHIRLQGEAAVAGAGPTPATSSSLPAMH